MQTLTSATNARFRAWMQLHTRKGREKMGSFLAEGITNVQELVQDLPAATVVVDEAYTGEIPAVRNTYRLATPLFRQLSKAVTPSGMLAIAPLPEWGGWSAEKVVPEVEETEGAEAQASLFYLLLDGIQDPGNLGTLLRTAWALGVTAVFCGAQTADPFQPKVIRAARRAAWRLPLFSLDLLAVGMALHSQQIPLWIAVPKGGEGVHRARWPRRLGLVLGSEAHGAQPELAAMASHQVTIPMVPGTDSLNVAISGALCMAARAWQQDEGAS